MKPVVTVDEMRAIDAASVVSERELIERAGRAVFVAARRMLGGTYGRRVAVIAGKGNNGEDGRVAARLLQNSGVKVVEINASSTEPQPSSRRPQPSSRRKPGSSNSRISEFDLVIDAAYGTGFHGDYSGPSPVGAPVLAVDIPSGVNGDTGEASESAITADTTVTFAALKPGHLLGDGRVRSGALEVADIGLDVSSANMFLVEANDVHGRLPPPRADAHKWQTPVAIVAGSPGMQGAAQFCAKGAARAGAGIVRLMMPGADPSGLPVTEAVASALPEKQWAEDALHDSDRVKAMVVGPGLGRSDATVQSVRELLRNADMPVVLDGDGLYAVSDDEGVAILSKRQAPTVLTPHDGEFERVYRKPPESRRWVSANELASRTGCVVLLKGSTSTIAAPDCSVLLSNTGDARLATAGTGDVLAGVIGAFLAQGIDAQWAAACGAYVHGAAARLGYSRGLVAGDLPKLVAVWLSK